MTTTTKPMDDGGFAFPWGEHGTRLGGLSMRDYFAAKAMQAAATNPEGANGFTFSERAKWAYEQADAMLRARQENSNGR